MKNDQGEVVGSVSKTMSSQESQFAVPQESYVTYEEAGPSVGYATGGVIERGRLAMLGSSASSSGAGPIPMEGTCSVDFGGIAQPRTYVPLTVEWPQDSGEWSLVTDDEDDDDCR